MTKVSSLPVATAMDDTDQFVIQDNGITKRINMSAIKSNFTSGSTVDGDLLKFKKVITSEETITGVGANNTIKVTVLKPGYQPSSGSYTPGYLIASGYYWGGGSKNYTDRAVQVPNKLGSTASIYTTGPSGGSAVVTLSNSDGASDTVNFDKDGTTFKVSVHQQAQYEVAVYGA